VYYAYDEAGHLVGEYDANQVPIYETAYLGDAPVAVVKQDRTTPAVVQTSVANVYTDQLGAPRVIARATDSAVLWRWDQAEAFGATPPDQNPSGLGVFTFNQRLPGQVFGAESNTFYNWHRNYHPDTGRYLQSDPIGLQGGLNTYGYVGGNPLSRVDPRGLASCTFSMSTGRLVCTPANQGNSPVDIPVASGNNGGGQQCRNNPACTAIPNHGPIPTGCWRWTNGSTGKPNGRVLEPCPGTNTNATENRTLIRSHSCANPFGPGLGPQYCSEGCVTGTAPDMQNLNGLIDAEPGSTLQVVP
jgi:RHS repeat-associated protein